MCKICRAINSSPGSSGGSTGSRAVFAKRMGWQIHPSGAHGGGMPTDRRGVGAVVPCTCLREECESTCEMASGPAPSRSPAEGNEVVHPPACLDGRERGFMPPSRKVDG